MWNFSSLSRQKCPELFSGVEIKEQAVAAGNLGCYFYVILFPLFSVPFVHLSYLCLLNRGKLLENCDYILSQAAAHEFDFNFNNRVFQIVHAFLLPSELVPQRYD